MNIKLLSDRDVKKIDDAVNCIMEILTRDGMTFEIAERVINRVCFKFKRDSKHFLKGKESKEVFGVNRKIDITNQVDDTPCEDYQ